MTGLYLNRYQNPLILSSQILDMGSLPVYDMNTSLIEGYPYRIMNAARRHTVLGPRLFVELAAPWGNVCKLPWGMLNLFTDHQIQLINRYKLTLRLFRRHAIW